MATPAQGAALPVAVGGSQRSINSLEQHLLIFLQINNLRVLGSCAVLCRPWPILVLPCLPPQPRMRAPSKESMDGGSAVAVGRVDVKMTDHKRVCPSAHTPAHEQEPANLPMGTGAVP